MKRKQLLACCAVMLLVVSCASCTLTLLYQNHSDDSTIDVKSSSSADSAQLNVTIPRIKSETMPPDWWSE